MTVERHVTRSARFALSQTGFGHRFPEGVSEMTRCVTNSETRLLAMKGVYPTEELALLKGIVSVEAVYPLCVLI